MFSDLYESAIVISNTNVEFIQENIILKTWELCILLVFLKSTVYTAVRVIFSIVIRLDENFSVRTVQILIIEIFSF